MGTIFCPYRGRDVSEEQSSLEHVVPESIGGTKQLCIQVERQANAELGTAVDGPVAQLFGYRRVQCDLRGHSGRIPGVQVEISVQELAGARGKWKISKQSSEVALVPVVTSECQPDGTTRLTVSGDPVEARRILNEIRKAREAEGRTVSIQAEIEQKIEQPWIKGTFTFDILAIARFFVKTCIGLLHWLAGESWSRGSDADTLRRALWANSVDEFNAVGLESASLTPSALGLHVYDWEHAFVLTCHPQGGCVLGLFFFGQQGHSFRVASSGGPLDAVGPAAVLVDVKASTVRRTSLVELYREGRLER